MAMFKNLKRMMTLHFPSLGRTPIQALIDDDLYEAERRLLEAQFNGEYWDAQETLMVDRVARLKAHKAALNETIEGKQLHMFGTNDFLRSLPQGHSVATDA